MNTANTTTAHFTTPAVCPTCGHCPTCGRGGYASPTITYAIPAFSHT